MAYFNIDGGYLEGLCRGFKCGILKQSDYLNLVQCETLEGLYIRYTQHFFLFGFQMHDFSCDALRKIASTEI